MPESRVRQNHMHDLTGEAGNRVDDYRASFPPYSVFLGFLTDFLKVR